MQGVVYRKIPGAKTKKVVAVEKVDLNRKAHKVGAKHAKLENSR